MAAITNVQDLPDVKPSYVVTANDLFPQVPPEVEDAAFQALALENAESWL